MDKLTILTIIIGAGIVVSVVILVFSMLNSQLNLENKMVEEFRCVNKCSDLEFKYKEFIEEGWRDGRMECWCYDPENNRSLQVW